MLESERTSDEERETRGRFSTIWLVSLSHATRDGSEPLQAALSLGRWILARAIELTRTRLTRVHCDWSAPDARRPRDSPAFRRSPSDHRRARDSCDSRQLRVAGVLRNERVLE